MRQTHVAKFFSARANGRFGRGADSFCFARSSCSRSGCKCGSTAGTARCGIFANPQPALKAAATQSGFDWSQNPSSLEGGEGESAATMGALAGEKIGVFWDYVLEFCVIVFPYILLRAFNGFSPSISLFAGGKPSLSPTRRGGKRRSKKSKRFAAAATRPGALRAHRRKSRPWRVSGGFDFDRFRADFVVGQRRDCGKLRRRRRAAKRAFRVAVFVVDGDDSRFARVGGGDAGGRRHGAFVFGRD